MLNLLTFKVLLS